jgi:hypothetical protein
MINLTDFQAWLVTQGVTTPIAKGPDNQPEDPTNHYTIWETGRIGLETEDALDNPTFECLTRGATGTVAWELADSFDRLVMSRRNFDLNGKRVLEIRNISGPVNLGTDERNRTEFSANYRVKLAR